MDQLLNELFDLQRSYIELAKTKSNNRESAYDLEKNIKEIQEMIIFKVKNQNVVVGPKEETKESPF